MAGRPLRAPFPLEAGAGRRRNPDMHADDGRVVSAFIIQALPGRPITVFGDGSQIRFFCYIDDMIDGLPARTRNAPDLRPGTS